MGEPPGQPRVYEMADPAGRVGREAPWKGSIELLGGKQTSRTPVAYSVLGVYVVEIVGNRGRIPDGDPCVGLYVIKDGGMLEAESISTGDRYPCDWPQRTRIWFVGSTESDPLDLVVFPNKQSVLAKVNSCLLPWAKWLVNCAREDRRLVALVACLG